jgi:spore germination cell wall hydrolase CwlJ-like protein
MIKFIAVFCSLLALLISIQPQHPTVEGDLVFHGEPGANKKVSVGLDTNFTDDSNYIEFSKSQTPSYLTKFVAGKKIPEILNDSQDFNCLAQAVYFEARGEPIEGQLAVAQVVLNRVKSPRYPNKVCAVVFQNEKRRHRCQFSFACDGKSDRPRHLVSWGKAKRISLVAVEGLWDDLSQEATHYHANYVSPKWSTSIEPIAQYGAHYFYKGIR